MRGGRARLACLGLIVLTFGGVRAATAQDEFYRGKTIRIVVGYTAGGGFDTYSRASAPLSGHNSAPLLHVQSAGSIR